MSPQKDVVKRKSYTSQIEHAFKFIPIVVLLGARQVGKTSIMTSMKLDGKLFMQNGQNPDTAALFQKYSDIESLLKIEFGDNLKGYWVIDEFQFIPNISTILKVLTDTYPELKVLCSGSSSLDILQVVEESLAGRLRVIPVYSLSLQEYLQFNDDKAFKAHQKYSLTTDSAIVNKKINVLQAEYLVYGGLPRVALASHYEDKIALLDDIYQTYLLKDVRSYVKNEDSVGFNKMLRLLAAQIGNMVNINDLSLNSGLSYKKCDEYLYILEQMFIIKLVEPYTTNKKKEITKMKKIFFTDLGLRNIIYRSFNSIDIRTDNGYLFENYVYLELVKKMAKGSKIFYYRTKDGAEVDFIIDNLKEIITVEAKYKQLQKPIYSKSLHNFNELENIKRSYFINQNINLIDENVHFIPPYLIDKIENL
jgi:predicted AAA+ superfamily ATPase